MPTWQASPSERRAFLGDLGDATVIVNVVGTERRAEFVDAQGGEPFPPVVPTYAGDLDWEALLDIYESAGAGEHSLSEIANRVGRNALVLESRIEGLAGLLPSELFDYKRTPSQFVGTLHVGNILLASRRQTREERIDATKLSLPARREALDSGKQEYSDYDHAVITIGGNQFYLATDRANTILAARILEYIANLPEKMESVSDKNIIYNVWHAMTTRERLMFIPSGKEERMFGSTDRQIDKVIRPFAIHIMSQLMSPLLVTRLTSGGSYKLNNKVQIAFQREPPPEGEHAGDLIPIFPPGTPRELVLAVNHPIPELAFRQADAILNDVLPSAPSLAQREAIPLLTLITNSDVKRAIRERLRTTRDSRHLEDVQEAVLWLIRISLRDGFEDAHRERWIGSFSAHGTHGAHLTSGRLPITTYSSDILQKWRIGLIKR